MSAYRPGVDSIVVNYQTPDDLKGFLDAYEVQPDFEDTLWVVNVDPTEHDRAVAKSFFPTYRDAYYIEHDTNVGYARAVNDAARWGNREVIAIFNADVRTPPLSVENCFGALKLYSRKDKWAALGPRQVNDEGKITHGGIFGTHEAPIHRGWMHTDQPQFWHDLNAITVSGSAYFILRSAWDELTDCPWYREVAPDALGAFLPTQHYYEETYCSYHLAAHGFTVGYLGSVRMIHRWHQASPVGGWAEQQMKESQAYFREACDAHGMAHD